jgi:multidrug resistance protein
MAVCTSTILAPALPQIQTELHIQGGEAALALILSIFLLGTALGPLIISPLSEVYGRVVVLQCGSLLFLTFNLACGFAQSQTQITIFRFFAGVGSSTPLGIGAGIIADCFNPEDRGLAIAIYNLVPLIGPAIGPIAGAFIAENTTWRWCFWATSIAQAVVQLIGLFVLRETWAPVVLARRRKEVWKTDPTSLYTTTESESRERTLLPTLWKALVRPMKLLTTQVIVQAICLYMAFLYGVSFLVFSTFSTLWTDHYGFPIGTGNLNYIALAVGFTFATQISSRLNDRIYNHLKEKNDDHGIPEYRLPMLVMGALLYPVGLLIYGWTGQYQLHWIVPDLGVAIYAAATFTSFQCLQTYLIDTYSTYAASAIAAAAFLRSIFGTVFPLFAPILYRKLEYGWGTTVIALVATTLGWPAPFLLWRFGPFLRAKSPYSAEKS